jgi:3-hydroxy-9,10-secoandrosta-1,3,5(10)-triene-9,17-dione monooxygenase
MASKGPVMMPAPSTYAEACARAQKLVPILAGRAARTEDARRISDETFADLHQTGLLRILQPRAVGGAELPYESLVGVTATLARGCGSTGWVYANLANHHFMLALWDERAQREIWGADGDALIGSALMFPPGRATAVQGGYKLTGRWKFSSGIDACAWTMVGGIASSDGELPDYRVFILPAGDYRIVDTWYAAGLRGTGSNDIEVTDVFVPEYRALRVDLMKGSAAAPGAAINHGPLYRLPVFDMFPYVVAAVALGIAQGAVEFFTEEIRHRVTSYSTTLLADYATTQARLGEAAAAVDAAERLLIENCRHAMALAEQSRAPSVAEKIKLRRDGAYAARLCTRAVDLLFEAGGADFLYEDKPMQRFFRDAHAAQSHYLLAWDVAAASAGKFMLGVAPDIPTL